MAQERLAPDMQNWPAMKRERLLSSRVLVCSPSSPILPTVRLSLRRGPVTVELSGRVPSPQAAEAVIRILRQESRRYGRSS